MRLNQETGDHLVVFGGGCGSCNVGLRKTRPPPWHRVRRRSCAAADDRRRSRHALSAQCDAGALSQRAGEAARPHAWRRPAEAGAQAQSHTNSAFGGFTTNALVSEARKYIGTNPTGRGSLWCGAFMDMVLKRTGHAGGGNLASAYARYGTRVSGPQVGAIAVMGRRGGGHVGVVSGIDANGNPIIVSGNHNRHGRRSGLSAHTHLRPT